MSLRNNKTSLHMIVAIPVTFIVLGAFAISIAAVVENLHFINATNQILGLVSTVRSLASSQNGVIQSPGEDILTDLEHAGQITPPAYRLNPWRGGLRAIALSSKTMRIESDLPTHDCRRLSLYFLEHQPTDLGIISMEAQSLHSSNWISVYPAQSTREQAAEFACGGPPYSRLALIFKIR